MQKTSEIQTISEVFRYTQPAFRRKMLGQRIFSVGKGICQEYGLDSLNMKNLMSPTPRNCFLNALILALKDSAEALVSLRSEMVDHCGVVVLESLKDSMGKEEKVRAKIMYHFLGGTLRCWWYEDCQSVLFIPLLGGIFACWWYISYLCAK